MDPIPPYTRLPPGGSSLGRNAVVLLPPEEPEANLPPRQWPPPQRPRWRGFAVAGILGAAGLFAWLQLGQAPTAPPAPMPAFAEGLGAMGADEATRESLTTDEGAAEQPAPPPPPSPTPNAAASEPAQRLAAVERGPAPARPVDRQPATPAGRAASDPAPPRAADPTPGVATTPQVATNSVELEPPPVARTVVRDLPQAAPQPRQPAPAPATATATADPAVGLEAAEAAIRQGASRFAVEVGRSIDGGSATLRGLILANDAAATDLVRFVETSKPSAAVDQLGPVALEGDLARAEARIGYAWRGEFGVTKRGSATVQVLARRVDGAWRVAGIQPLTGPPR